MVSTAGAQFFTLCLNPGDRGNPEEHRQELMKNMLTLLNTYSVSILAINDDIDHLAEAYRAKILSKEINDTLHIATASYYALDAIVSWNFRHIVNLKTMKVIHQINQEQNAHPIEILTLEHVGGDQYGTL